MMIPAIIPKIPVQRRVLPNFLSTFLTSKLIIVLETPVKRAQKAKMKGMKVTFSKKVPEKSQIAKRTVITPVKRSQPLFSSAEKYLMISEIPLTMKMRANKMAKDRRLRAEGWIGHQIKTCKNG